jgi:hypothetical protein
LIAPRIASMAPETEQTMRWEPNLKADLRTEGRAQALKAESPVVPIAVVNAIAITIPTIGINGDADAALRTSLSTARFIKKLSLVLNAPASRNGFSDLTPRLLSRSRDHF